jgi:hypothetical protein
MPRTEARIFTSIWRDDHFLALPASAQRLYMFLLSQDDLSYCGVMPLRPTRWAKKAPDTTVAGVEQDLKALEASGRMFVVVDEDSVELMVRTLLRRDGIWKQPNLLKQARESAEQVESPKIRTVLLGELHRIPLHETGSDLVRTLITDFVSDLDQGTDHPSGYPPRIPSDEPSDTGSDDPSDNSTPEDYARAQGLGENYIAVRDSPDPLFPVAPTSLPPKSQKNATRLPDAFVLTADLVAWAAANSPHVNPEREFDRFRDYWRAKAGRDGRKLDWLATWRNWMRTAEDRQRPRERPGRQQETNDQFDRAMERARQREGTL